MAYCARCGYKCSFFKSWTFPDGTLCNDCLKELGVSDSERDKYMSMSGTYEMLLAEKKLQNPEIELLPIGERKGDDFQEPKEITVRTLNEILEEHRLENVNVSLEPNEICYFKGSPSVCFQQTQRVTTGGGPYMGVSFKLGGGVRLGVGGRPSKKTKTKEKTVSIIVDFYLTSKRMLFKAKEKFYSIYFSDIESITWHTSSFDVITEYDNLTFSNVIMPMSDVERLYYLIQLTSPMIDSAETTTLTSFANTSSDASPDPIHLLREYKKLLDEGIITQDEFEIKKAELLKL